MTLHPMVYFIRCRVTRKCVPLASNDESVAPMPSNLKLKGSGSLLSIFIEIVDRLPTNCEFMLVSDIPSWCSWFDRKPLLVTTDSVLANLAQDRQSWKINDKRVCYGVSKVLGQNPIHDPCPCFISHATRNFV